VFEQTFDCNDLVTILENTQNTFTLLYKEDIVLYIGIRDLEETEEEMNYETYQSIGNAVSSDSDAVGVLMDEGTISKVTSPSDNDLALAIEWIATYQVGDDLEVAQKFANVIAFLDLTIQTKNQRRILAEAKRQYAKQHGVKVSQVKIMKEAN